VPSEWVGFQEENKEEMVSDSDLVTRLREILRRSDLDTATAGSIRRQLEEDLGVDLSEKKKFIREQIDTFLETFNGGEGKSENVSENENTENDAVGDEENENDAVKEEEEEEEVETETKESKGYFFLYLYLWLNKQHSV